MNTLLLWFGPAIFLMIAAFGFFRYLNRQAAIQRSQTGASFTHDEQERLDELLNARRSA